MASPLGWFRRNQKGMLIFFGAILMAVFGLGSVLNSVLQSSGGGEREADKVVVRYNGGKYTRRDFQNYRNRHIQALDFVKEVRRVAIDKVGQENYRPTSPQFEPIRFDRPESSDRAVMLRMTKMKIAQDMGVTLGDDAVIDYLRGIANNDVTLEQKDFQQLAFDVYGPRGDFTKLKNQLKQELTIYLMDSNVLVAGLPQSPNLVEAYEDFLKLNRRRAGAVVQVPVEDYIAKVSGEPSLSDLRKIFADGQYDFPTLDNREPGFKTLRKIKVGLFSANFEDFLTSEVASVKPEEIQERYEEMVEAKDSLVMELIPTEDAGDGETPAGEDAPPEMNLDGEGEGEAAEGEATESTDETEMEAPADENAGGAEETTEAGGEESTEEGGEESTKEGEDDDDGLPLAGPSASSNRQEEQEEAKQESGEETKQEEETPAGETEDQAEAAANQAEQNEEATADAGSEATADQQPVAVPDISPNQDILDSMQLGGERRVKELDEELSKLIAREIARGPAYTTMTTAIQNASTEISEYSSDLIAFNDSKDGPKADRQPEPEMVNPAEVAKDYKVQYQETGLFDLLQLRESLVGLKQVAVQRPMFGRMMSDGQQLSDYMFTRYNDISEWQPEQFIEFRTDNSNSAFIIEKANPVIREFDEAKDDVIKFWKYNQAVELALADAMKMADGLNSSGESVVEKYPAKAKELDQFTFNGRGELYPTLPGGVETSEEFMKAAFSVDMGKASAATDRLRKNAYLVQISALDDRPEEELQKAFFDEMAANTRVSNDLFRLYTGDTGDFFQKYFENVEEDMNIQWLTH